MPVSQTGPDPDISVCEENAKQAGKPPRADTTLSLRREPAVRTESAEKGGKYKYFGRRAACCCHCDRLLGVQ